MFCKNCGGELGKADKYCAKCGKTVCEETHTCGCAEGCPCQAKTFAVIGFIASFFNPIAGLILSIISVAKFAKLCNKKGRGLAVAGIVISSIIIFALLVAAFVGIASSFQTVVYVNN